MKTQKKTAEDAINQIFEKKYYKCFCDGVNDKFIIGIQLDCTAKPIITVYEVRKYEEKGLIEDKKSWNIWKKFN